MKYSQLVKTPGSLVPKSAQVMRNPGVSRNYDFAENCLLRESAMVRELIEYFLKSPPLEKAEEYWEYFKSQWKQNIINYIKNTNGLTNVSDVEVNHYKNHYKYRTALRFVGEYVERCRDIEKIKNRFPDVPPEQNKLLFGSQRVLNEIHSRLMPYYKQMKESIFDPDAIVKK